MKRNIYRMASWWLSWEDLIFPEPGVEEKIIQRAKEFRAAGIDTVVIFGCHFRWDYIYNWDRFHHLLKFIVDTCHEEGLRVFDHHSANLVHRVDTLDGYRNINEMNRHHVPFFPSREFADTITYDGHKLNDFRMISVQDGKPCSLDRYDAESFCMNNPGFAGAYRKYLKKLLGETGVDGLMCDDVIYYPSWDGCGCGHCREKFKKKYGHDLPPTTDETFWGNYESSLFKDWMHMRYHDSLDFLTGVKETVGDGFPLMSCCANSTGKGLDGSGMNAIVMAGAMNHIMLEICGEIVSEEDGFFERVPGFMLHKAIADKHGFANIGLGYAHNPDSAFVVWAFCKLFGSSAWISTLTGRFGVAEDIRKAIPDEAAIIQEAYGFERRNRDLFSGEGAARLGVLFSLENLMYNGVAQVDYSQPWQEVVRGLFRQNVQFNVVLDIPSPEICPFLLLSHLDCLSDELGDRLLDYMNNGGTIIAAGLLGFRDERGVLREEPFLAGEGLELRDLTFAWNVPGVELFAGVNAYEPDSGTPKGCRSSFEVVHDEVQIARDEWFHSGSLHWLPEWSLGSVIGKVNELLPSADLEISCPDGWVFRILEESDTHFIHFLASDIKAVPHEKFRNTILDKPVIKGLEFGSGGGRIDIRSSAPRAVLHSPDLPESVKLERSNGGYGFELELIKRYFVVEL